MILHLKLPQLQLHLVLNVVLLDLLLDLKIVTNQFESQDMYKEVEFGQGQILANSDIEISLNLKTLEIVF